MATISEMLVGSALQHASDAPDISGSIQQGAALGQHIAAVQAQRAQMEQAKQAAYVAKIEKFSSLYETAEKLPPAAQTNFINNIIPKTRDALGLTKEFPDQTLNVLNKTPEVVAYLKGKVEAGELTLPDLVSHMQDPQWIADHVPEALREKAGKDLSPQLTPELDSLQKSDKFRIEEANKKTNAEIVQLGQNQRQSQEIAATGPKEVAKKTADIYTAFQAGGGEAGVDKNIEKYRNAIKSLKDGTVKLGTIGKALPFGADERVMAVLDPKAKALIDDVRGGVNLRATLADPNPTEKQISAVMSRTIDPRLSNEENIKKLEASIKEMQQSKTQAVKAFKQQGFPVESSAAPSTTTPAGNFAPSDAQKASFSKLPANEKMRALQGLMKKFNLPLSEVRKALGGQ